MEHLFTETLWGPIAAAVLVVAFVVRWRAEQTAQVSSATLRELKSGSIDGLIQDTLTNFYRGRRRARFVFGADVVITVALAVTIGTLKITSSFVERHVASVVVSLVNEPDELLRWVPFDTIVELREAAIRGAAKIKHDEGAGTNGTSIVELVERDMISMLDHAVRKDMIIDYGLTTIDRDRVRVEQTTSWVYDLPGGAMADTLRLTLGQYLETQGLPQKVMLAVDGHGTRPEFVRADTLRNPAGDPYYEIRQFMLPVQVSHESRVEMSMSFEVEFDESIAWAALEIPSYGAQIHLRFGGSPREVTPHLTLFGIPDNPSERGQLEKPPDVSDVGYYRWSFEGWFLVGHGFVINWVPAVAVVEHEPVTASDDVQNS